MGAPPPRLLGLGLALATLVAYGPVAGADFVNFDDHSYVLRNPWVNRGLSWDAVIAAFTGFRNGNWHPLTWVSHMLDVSLFGLNPVGHHLVNLALHVAGALVLFAAVRRLAGGLWRPWLVAAVFALHPLHVESVAWIAERKDVLSGLFFALCLLAWARHREAPSHGRYALALAMFAAGLMSKPMLVTLPCVLLLFDVWPLRRWPDTSPAPLLIEKLPFFALSAISSAITVAAQKHGGAVETLEMLPLGARVTNAVVAYATYLRQSVWPGELAIYYPHPEGALPDATVAASAVLLVAVTAFALLQLRKRPQLLVGWLFFLGTLVPVIGLLQVGNQSHADRYTYLPYIGLTLALAYSLPPHRVIAGAVGLVLFLFAGQTYVQASYWHNSETLFRHALEVTQDNYVAWHNLGVALIEDGRADEAIHALGEARRVDPGSPEAPANHGVAFARAGRHREAVVAYEAAIALQPDNPQTWSNLGASHRRLNRTSAAETALKRALELDPNRAPAHYELGLVYATSQKLEPALTHLSRAVELRPAWAEAHNNLGALYANLGRPDDARRHLRMALRLRPDFEDAKRNLLGLESQPK